MHCHGAAPTTSMAYFAIQQQLSGKLVDWPERVSAEPYRAVAADD